jgi:hypothetical protein
LQYSARFAFNLYLPEFKQLVYIYSRGYSVERESGRMTGPKTAFLQGLIQGAVYEVGTKIRKTYEAVRNDKNVRPTLRKVERWLGEPLPVEGEIEGSAGSEGRAVDSGLSFLDLLIYCRNFSFRFQV